MTPAASADLPTIDLLTLGLTTLDIALHPFERTPARDEGLLLNAIQLSPAGTAGGVALVAARLGLKVAIVSAVGDDLQGVAVRAGLAREGVDTTLLETLTCAPTSTTVLPVHADGQRGTLHMVGASARAQLPDAAWALLKRVRAVHWGALGCPELQAQGPAFLAAARAAGAFVSCDLISPGPQSAAEVAALLPHVDLFMPSLAELPLLAGTHDPADAAARFLELGARSCIIKQGRAGATLYTRPDQDLVTIHTPALAITPHDTTSCGDALCAGFHAARLSGLAPAAALHFAGAVAASVAMGVGTLGALASFEQADTLAQQQAVAA